MGENLRAPINEAVNLLSNIDPDSLKTLINDYPALGNELILGREGGEQETPDDLDIDRAWIMIKALDKGRLRAEQELCAIRGRIIRARKSRFLAQAITLIGSSGVLALLASRGGESQTVLAAIVTLLASIWTMIAEHTERLLKPGGPDIYDTFERASKAAYRAGLKIDELCLLIKHLTSKEELKNAVASANALCEELNELVVQMSGGSQIAMQLKTSTA